MQLRQLSCSASHIKQLVCKADALYTMLSVSASAIAFAFVLAFASVFAFAAAFAKCLCLCFCCCVCTLSAVSCALVAAGLPPQEVPIMIARGADFYVFLTAGQHATWIFCMPDLR
jgi:hypothetical protein